MRISFFIALVFSSVSLLACLVLFGGSWSDIFQLPGLILVFSGTFSSLVISYSFLDIKSAFGALLGSDVSDSLTNSLFHKELLDISQTIRKDGLLALDQKKSALHHSFLKRYTQYIAEGMERESLREILETDIQSIEKNFNKNAEVFETAGLFSPVFGMIGAVFGLLPIFSDLTNTEALGNGMVSAFITLVYGLALAYMLFLPVSIYLKKITLDFKVKSDFFKMCILSLQEGVSPLILEEKLKGFYGKSE